MLSAYAVRQKRLVNRATLPEVGDWHLGQDADEYVEELFRARELIAFAALAERRLFRGHMDYCNFDTYALVIQRYQPGSTGAFSFSTRRRDGGTQQVWGADDFTFLKPLHVDSRARLRIDEPLLAVLLKADEADRLPVDAIAEFNRANTDSQDVPIHTEVVMTKSAFEYLLGIGHGIKEFVDALNRTLPPTDGRRAAAFACERATRRIAKTIRQSLSALEEREGPAEREGEETEGTLAERWKCARPKAESPLEAWAREFCDRRGGAAHGKQRGGDRFVWSEYAHLAFASILFPLLVKLRLAQDGFLQIGERDAIELEWIEAYLMHDPFDPVTAGEDLHEHPWSRVYSEGVLGELLRRSLERQMADTDWNNLPPE